MSNELYADVVVVGAGFSGLSAAYELVKLKKRVIVFDSEPSVGGLAGSYQLGSTRLDFFYHHWFTSDTESIKLIQELGISHLMREKATNTGMFYANKFFKLSTPFDLINFKPLNLFNRLRLGFLVLYVRKIEDWRKLEGITAKKWLLKLGGSEVYKVVWEPLLRGKFGAYAELVSAVWFWNKIKLRGGSRGKRGEERLLYMHGAFSVLAERLADKIIESGGTIYLSSPVREIFPVEGRGWEILLNEKSVVAKRVIVTTPLPITAKLITGWASQEYINSLKRINYLGNVCLILVLNKSLSNTYWLNVNDPSFPFVGIIEHTNLEDKSAYQGKHIVYLSKYLTTDNHMFLMSRDEMLDFSIPYLKKMFPEFKLEWIDDVFLWKSEWSQPVIESNYSKYMPKEDGPIAGFHICTMAQIYPEDRGTNYAIKAGRKLGQRIGKLL